MKETSEGVPSTRMTPVEEAGRVETPVLAPTVAVEATTTKEAAASSALVTVATGALGAGRSTITGPLHAPGTVEASSPVSIIPSLLTTLVMAGPSLESSRGPTLGGFDEGATSSDTHSSLATMPHALRAMAGNVEREILPAGQVSDFCSSF